MRILPILLILSTIALASKAQTEIDARRVGNNATGQLTFYDIDGSRNMLPYSRISGSPFWRDEWMKAKLIDENNKLIGVYKTKVNLATNEIYYIDKDGKVLVAPSDVVRQVLFISDDNSKTIAVFSNGAQYVFSKKDKGQYAQVMNEGKAQLLKLTRQVATSADSMFSTLKRYYFKTVTSYYIYSDGKTEPLRLNKSNVLSLLPNNTLAEKWADDNKINFKKEEDVVKYLNYYNSIIGSK